MFPFYWKGVQYYECTDADDTAKWCAISLPLPVLGGGLEDYYYGYCAEGC